MFGARHFGHRFFGPRYFGDGSDTPPAEAETPTARIVRVDAETRVVSVPAEDRTTIC